MIYVPICLAVVVFTVALVRLRLPHIASEAIDTALVAGRAMWNPELDEDEKERAVQSAAATLLRQFLSLMLRGFAALGISLIPMLLFDWAGIVGFAESSSAILSWQAICLSLVVAVIAYFALRPTK